jgi:ribokinase
VIVVVGSPLHRPGSATEPPAAAGLAARIAAAAAAAGRDVQLVGRVGEDPAGEATLLALARSGIGHVATLRDPVHPTPAVRALADDDRFPIEELDRATDADPASSLGPPGSATLDRGDVELALRYLDGFAVLVVAEPLDLPALTVTADAAAYAGATLVLLVRDGDEPAAPDDAIVLAAPDADPDGVFARTIGRFAAELDAGADPEVALAAATAAGGWERTADG